MISKNLKVGDIFEDGGRKYKVTKVLDHTYESEAYYGKTVSEEPKAEPAPEQEETPEEPKAEPAPKKATPKKAPQKKR